MKPFARSDRVGGQIQKALSDLLHRSIKDPRLEKVLITGVKMSRDLRLARIYFTLTDHPRAGDDASVKAGAKNQKTGLQKSQEDAAKGFKSALGFIKRSLAQELGLRYMPDLRFYSDQSFDYGSRIETLLKTLKTDHARDN